MRYYPSRGVAYESHLTPPPHLVGLRVAALDALTDTPAGIGAAGGHRLRRRAVSEKVPDPELRPHGFTLRKGDLLDLDEAANDLVAGRLPARRPGRGARPVRVRGGLLDIYPATEERAVRVDLFDVEIDSLRWFSTFTQRSLGEADEVEIAPAAELAPEHRELAEIAATEEERPDIAELLPVDRFRELLDLIPGAAQIVIAADEDTEPSLRDHWDDVCAAFHDEDAHHLYVKPDRILQTLDDRAAIRLSSISADQPTEIRAQSADFAARTLKEAEAELEKLTRSGYTTVVAWPQRGAAERAAYNLARLKADLNGGTTGLIFTEANLRDGFVAPGLKLAAFPEHRLIHRRKASHAADAQGPRPAAHLHRPADRRHRRPRGPRHRALRRLRHQDRRRRHARLPQPRVPGRRQGLPARRPAREDLALRRRRRLAPAAEQARRQPLGPHEGARPPRRAGAGRRAAQPLRRAQAPPRPRRSRSSPTSCASWRPRSRTARRPTSATRSTP